MILLVLLQRKKKEPYSHCFWKGFLIGFLLMAGILVALRLAGVIHMAMIFGLPIAFGAGCVTGLVTEIIRNRMMDKGFWKNC